jgi:hypothetical protein
MKFETLLAKSFDMAEQKIPTYARLLPHLRLVEDAGKTIFGLVVKSLQRVKMFHRIFDNPLFLMVLA